MIRSLIAACAALGVAACPPVHGGAGEAPRGIAQADSVPAFTGAIATTSQVRALDKFLAANAKAPRLRLDLRLTSAQVSELGPDDMNRLYLDLSYRGELGNGSELLVLLDDGPAVTMQPDPSGGAALRMCVRMVEVSGPRQGIMSYAVAPLPSDDCQHPR